MKRINVWFLTAVVTVSIVCISSFGWAQSQDDPPPMPPAPQGMEPTGPGSDREQGDYGNIRVNWKQLELTEEQQAQIDQKRREFRINTAGMREELQLTEQDLRREMVKDPVDRAKIDKLVNDLSALKQKMGDAALQNLLAIRGILTPEQLEKLGDFQAQIPAEFKWLQLTPEQRSQIQAILKNSLKQNKAATEILRELRMELRDMLLSPQEIDTAKLKQLQQDIAAKDLVVEKGRVDMVLQLKDVLTPEQRQKLQEAKAFQKARERREEQFSQPGEKNPRFPVKPKNK
jgi:Spy/CpxP family protein refolding chaperone